MKSCFFIGHREASSEIFPALTEAVEKHIKEYGVTEFIVGNYGGFDHMAAKAVIAAKEWHPNITLSMLIPYHPAERPIDPPQGFDNTFYPPGMEKVPRKLAIVRANRYMVLCEALHNTIYEKQMVDRSDFVVFCIQHESRGAWQTMKYSQKQGKPYINISSDPMEGAM